MDIHAADRPPSALSPLLAGLVVTGRVTPTMVTAFLVDLAERGYVVIVKKQDEYYLTAGRVADQHLQEWEAEILDQLLPYKNERVTENEAKATLKKTLFSAKVADAFNQIYQVVTDIGIFYENPHLTRIRAKLIALSFYFLGLVMLGWAVIANQSLLLIVVAIGLLLAAGLVIRLASKLVRYTPEGQQSRQQWLAFQAYLAARAPLGLTEIQNRVFERYLAYAIAFDCGQSWAERFETSSTLTIRPNWFVSYAELDPGQLTTELTSFTGVIAKELAGLRGPLVR